MIGDIKSNFTKEVSLDNLVFSILKDFSFVFILDDKTPLQPSLPVCRIGHTLGHAIPGLSQWHSHWRHQNVAIAR